jgi:thiamine biosynthesis protein ThiS
LEIRVDNESMDMTFSGTIGELLRELKLMREEVVVKVNGKLAPETRALSAKDRVEIIKVVFGG